MRFLLVALAVPGRALFLDTLSVSNGSVSPSVTAEQTSYECFIDYGVRSVTVFAASSVGTNSSSNTSIGIGVCQNITDGPNMLEVEVDLVGVTQILDLCVSDAVMQQSQQYHLKLIRSLGGFQIPDLSLRRLDIGWNATYNVTALQIPTHDVELHLTCDGATLVPSVLIFNTTHLTATFTIFANEVGAHAVVFEVNGTDAFDFASPPSGTVIITALELGGLVPRLGVGVHVLNVGDIDLRAGKFYADFELFLFVEVDDDMQDVLYDPSALADEKGASVCNFTRKRVYCPADLHEALIDQGLFLPNVDRYRTVNIVRDNHGNPHHYRVQANFYFRASTKDWPFDTELLKITLEDQADTTNETNPTLGMCHLESYSGLSDEITFPGPTFNSRLSSSFKIDHKCHPPFRQPTPTCENSGKGIWLDRNCDCEVVTHHIGRSFQHESCGCQGGMVAASRYTFEISYQLPVLNGFLTCFLAPLIILLVNLTSFFFKTPRFTETRFGICSSALLGTVLFYTSLLSSRPVAGEMMLADWIMLALLGLNLGTFLCSLLLVLTVDNEVLNSVLFQWMRLIGPPLSLTAITTTFWAVSHGPDGSWFLKWDFMVAIWFITPTLVVAKLLALESVQPLWVPCAQRWVTYIADAFRWVWRKVASCWRRDEQRQGLITRTGQSSGSEGSADVRTGSEVKPYEPGLRFMNDPSA